MHAQNKSSEQHSLLQERIEDDDRHENFDETDGPTFLPQRPLYPYYDIFGGALDEEVRAASTLTPDASWKYVIEPPEALHELVQWVISTHGEPLPPVAPEVLAMAAISIGACPDDMGDWNPE